MGCVCSGWWLGGWVVVQSVDVGLVLCAFLVFGLVLGGFCLVFPRALALVAFVFALVLALSFG